MGSNDTTDDDHIRQLLEQGEQYDFRKPWFSQGWAVGLFWIMIVSAYYLYRYPSGRDMYYANIAMAIALGFTLLKYFTSTRRIEIKGDYVRVYTWRSHRPAREYRFSRMTSWLEVDSIFIIRKTRFLGGVQFRKIYWYPYWDELKRIFLSKPKYCMQRDPRASRSRNPQGHIADGIASGGNIFNSIAIVFEWVTTPYLLIGRAFLNDERPYRK